jgi:hypothetical protein
MTEDITDHVIAAQKVARSGDRPHQILRLLLARVEPNWPGHIPFIGIERCLMKAFDIPLREVRDIEPWKGFSEQGNASDQEIDDLLEPWITRYLKQHP